MPSKGHVYKRGDTWFYKVYDSSPKIVFMDNTCDWRKVFDACLDDVKAARRVETAGHKFKYSYPELVDIAAGQYRRAKGRKRGRYPYGSAT